MTDNKPTKPCYTCDSSNWWLRDNGVGKPEWLRGKCHPEPKEVNNAENTIDH